MNDIPPINIPFLLRKYGLRPRKGLGQNFLQDPIVLETIVAAAQIGPADSVLEIGPGLGSLTRYLASSAQSVVAVELDQHLLPPLKAVLSPYENVRIIHGDILELNPADLIQQPNYIVAANVPYYITSAIIRHLLEATPRPRRIVLTVQKEVAQRICEKPGDLSLLALSVQVYGEPRVVAHVPAGAFVPSPNVDSSVLTIEIYPASLIAPDLLDTFFQLIKAGFSQKRKTLRNSLSSGLSMSPTHAAELLIQAGIDPQRRAETLSMQEWSKLAAAKRALTN